MAIPVPICPDPTTPKDFTVENLEKTLNIIDRDIIQMQIFQVTLLINNIISRAHRVMQICLCDDKVN